MANEKTQKNTDDRNINKTWPPSRSILKAVVSGVELNDDQKNQIKQATGVDVEWLLFHHFGASLARDIDPSAIALVKLSYCW